MEKLIITVALDGAEVTKEQNPYLPVTPVELAEDAARVRNAGAAMVHVHGRLPDGTPTQSGSVYAEILKETRERTDIIVQTSTGGAVWMTAEERLQPVMLKPEMASLTTGTVNFGRDVFMNSPEMIEQFARTMVEQGVVPEIEAFDMGHINNALALVKQGILKLPLHFDFVMGVPGGIAPTVKNLLLMSESIPEGCTWSVAGIGRAQLPLATAAILLGGHVRVGLEDNVYYSKGVLASNEMLVARVVRLARELGREVATPDEARRILRLSERTS
ncbi:MAG TPA: 3-keto-5-aminohexanoate cleavage protein [Symbiobacteriaceae bacterium]|jgi:3-keto-5-aminohexanoate cleavage enzyme|nr:3-keto-5-aminohexanoate cleavage protein [Symbiobacteriaceae bacterium]